MIVSAPSPCMSPIERSPPPSLKVARLPHRGGAGTPTAPGLIPLAPSCPKPYRCVRARARTTEPGRGPDRGQTEGARHADRDVGSVAVVDPVGGGDGAAEVHVRGGRDPLRRSAARRHRRRRRARRRCARTAGSASRTACRRGSRSATARSSTPGTAAAAGWDSRPSAWRGRALASSRSRSPTSSGRPRSAAPRCASSRRPAVARRCPRRATSSTRRSSG